MSRTVLGFGIPARFATAYQVSPCLAGCANPRGDARRCRLKLRRVAQREFVPHFLADFLEPFQFLRALRSLPTNAANGPFLCHLALQCPSPLYVDRLP